MRRRTALVAALALGLAGCLLAPARQPEPGPREGEWAEALRGSTRRARLYDGLVHRATVTATHLSLPVREARARRLALWLGWTDEELDRRLAAERAEAEAGEEFLVALYTSDPRANDLDARPSIWRLALDAGEGKLVAARVEGVDVNATVRTLYPYVGPFDLVYRVHFPRATAAADGTLVLELASVLGRLGLDYRDPGAVDPDVADRPSPGATAP